MVVKIKNYITVILFAGLLLCMMLLCFLKPQNAFSDSERRALRQYPKLSWQAFYSGDYAKALDAASPDQFPFRDPLRTVKSIVSYKLFRRLDSNGIYLSNGHASKLDYPLHDDSVRHAVSLFQKLYEAHLKEKRVYFSLVPDKNYYLAKKNGYPEMDYQALAERLKDELSFASYIDITDDLTIDDYYRTDTHWRQERLLPVAERLARAMGSDITAAYGERTLDRPFYGVYHGQSALPLAPDSLRYLTNDTLEHCTVTVYEGEGWVKASVYDMEKAKGKDPYSIFLSGPVPILTIENPDAASAKSLVMFRDSFGSSLAPLFAAGYAKITLVDIRYVSSDIVGRFLTSEDSDVLFLYSTLVLNHSDTLR